MKDDKKRGKHLTQCERETIERMLDEGCSLAEIAERTGKSESTISKEIRARRQPVDRSGKRRFNDVKITQPCNLLDRFPLCCNACPKRRYCTKDGFLYSAKAAHEQYRARLTEGRSGIDMTPGELEELDRIVSAGVRAGKSPETILMEHPELDISVRTIYRYISEGVLSVKNIDLRRKVSYAPRKRKKPKKIRDHGIYLGRNYLDYTLFKAAHPGTVEIQMDTVIGAQSCAHRLLTLEFPDTRLMLVRLLPDGSRESVSEALALFAERLGPRELAEAGRPVVLLTDRGSEFTDPELYESLGFRVFYCDASCPWQKGGVESGHRLLRYAFPKGSDFDALTPEMVAAVELAMANTRRRILSSYTPLQLARAQLGEEITDRLGLKEVDATNIDLGIRIRAKNR